MYQASRRYLGSADAETRRFVGSAVAHGRRRLKTLPRFRYEVPDTTWFALTGTTLNLLNATTGPGLLALPLAFARCGWLLGTLLLLLVFFLNHASLGLLLRACLTTREHSYIGLCGQVSAATASLIDWSAVAFFFGSSVSYLVIIGEAFTLMTAPFGSGPVYQGGPVSDGPLHYSAMALLLLLLFTLAVLAPLSFLRSMDSLQCTSAAGIVCLLYAVGIIIAYGPQNKTPPPAGIPAPPLPMFVLTAEALVSLPTLTFCFSSQPLFPPALETLHQPATYNHMNSVVDVTMYLTLALHLAVGLSGALAFGSAVAPNVLDSLPQTAPVLAARLGVVLAFAFTFPMMIFLCRMHLRAILARARAPAAAAAAGVLPLNPPTGAGASLIDRGWAADPSVHTDSSIHTDFSVHTGPLSAALPGALSEDDTSIHSGIHSQADPKRPDPDSGTAAESDSMSEPDGFRHGLVSGLLVAGSLACAVCFPNIDAIFGLLGGTTSVVLSFVAPAIFWQVSVGYMFSWRHPTRLFCTFLLAFSALIASLSLPGVLLDILGDLYATTWWVPMASTSGLSSWKGSTAVANAVVSAPGHDTALDLTNAPGRATALDLALAASMQLPAMAHGAATAVASAAAAAVSDAAKHVRRVPGSLTAAEPKASGGYAGAEPKASGGNVRAEANAGGGSAPVPTSAALRAHDQAPQHHKSLAAQSRPVVAQKSLAAPQQQPVAAADARTPQHRHRAQPPTRQGDTPQDRTHTELKPLAAGGAQNMPAAGRAKNMPAAGGAKTRTEGAQYVPPAGGARHIPAPGGVSKAPATQRPVAGPAAKPAAVGGTKPAAPKPPAGAAEAEATGTGGAGV